MTQTVPIGQRASNSITQSAPRQGSTSPIGCSLLAAKADMRRWWEPGGELRSWNEAHTRSGSGREEEAPRRQSWRLLRLNEGRRPCGGSRSFCSPVLSPSWCTCGWHTDSPPRRRTTTHTRVLFNHNPGLHLLKASQLFSFLKFFLYIWPSGWLTLLLSLYLSGVCCCSFVAYVFCSWDNAHCVVSLGNDVNVTVQ